MTDNFLNLNNFSLLKYFLNEKKFIVISCLFGLMLGVIASFFIVEKFETSFSFFPLSINSYNPIVNNQNESRPKDFFGSREDISRVNSILKDKNFKLQVLNRFYTDYKRLNLKEYRNQIYFERDFEELEANFKIQLNSSEGIFTLKVLNKNRDTSEIISKIILQQLEYRLKNDIVSKNNKIIQVLKEKVIQKKSKSDSIRNKVLQLKLRYGIFDAKSQLEALSQNVKSKLHIGSRAANIDTMIVGLQIVSSLEESLKYEMKACDQYQSDLEFVLNSSEVELSPISISQFQYTSIKKPFFTRLFVVLSLIFSFFIISLFYLGLKFGINNSKSTL